MIKEEDIRSIGKFQKTHALKGELNMISEIDPEYFMEGNPLIIEYDGLMVPYYAETVRPKGSTSFLIKLDGVDTEEEARSFVNKDIYILRKDAEEWLGEEDEDLSDLIGYEIKDAVSDKAIGTIKGIEDSTANILFIVEVEKEDEIYIPASEDFITEIDDETKTIRMDLPEGLIELKD